MLHIVQNKVNIDLNAFPGLIIHPETFEGEMLENCIWGEKQTNKTTKKYNIR